MATMETMQEPDREWHPHQSHTLEDGRVLTMLNNYLLVRPHEQSKISGGGIHLTGDTHPLNSGTVLAFGTVEMKDGRLVPIPDLKVGDIVVFVKYLAEQHSNHYIRANIDGLIRIQLSDVIVVADEEDLPKLFA